MGPAGFGPQVGGFASGPGGFSIRIEDLGDLGGIFGHLFGDGRGRAGPGGPMPMRGQDLETRVGISFRDAVEGADRRGRRAGPVVGRHAQGEGTHPRRR